uniref:Uncharacterized protein n=1 Tax=Acrobeloides nanus TaxID=290746 RepID=A0A914C515_9BILA
MGIFLDAMTSQFLAAMAHASMIFCLLWVREDYVLSSLPPGKSNQEEYDDLDVSFSINL